MAHCTDKQVAGHNCCIFDRYVLLSLKDLAQSTDYWFDTKLNDMTKRLINFYFSVNVLFITGHFAVLLFHNEFLILHKLKISINLGIKSFILQIT